MRGGSPEKSAMTARASRSQNTVKIGFDASPYWLRTIGFCRHSSLAAMLSEKTASPLKRSHA